jgi:hypothetical protein
MIALLSSAWLVPALVGPVVVGQVAGLVSWRAVFLGLVPAVLTGALICIPAARGLPKGSVTDGVSRIGASVLAFGAGMLLSSAAQPSFLATLGLAAFGALLAVPALLEVLPRRTLVLGPGLPAGTVLRFLLAFGFSAARRSSRSD